MKITTPLCCQQSPQQYLHNPHHTHTVADCKMADSVRRIRPLCCRHRCTEMGPYYSLVDSPCRGHCTRTRPSLRCSERRSGAELRKRKARNLIRVLRHLMRARIIHLMTVHVVAIAHALSHHFNALHGVVVLD